MILDIYCAEDWSEMEDSDAQNLVDLAFMAGYCEEPVNA